MTDTTAPTWGTVLKNLVLGLLPSMNTSVIAIVTAGVTLGGTLATQKLMAPSGKTEVAKLSALSVTDEVIHRLSLIEGNTSLLIDEVQALRKDWKTPKPPEKAKPIAPTKAAAK